MDESEKYVSRAALKLAGVAAVLGIDFKNRLVLDVGSSTGGFTDYALRHGARGVVAVDAGSDQLHPLLRQDSRVELHEKTDIRGFEMPSRPDVILADLSFVSLREVLPDIARLAGRETLIVVLLKPQFETGKSQLNRGIVKNDRLRRQIIKEFEEWLRGRFVITAKADSPVAGTHGNRERFYSLKKLN